MKRKRDDEEDEVKNLKRPKQASFKNLTGFPPKELDEKGIAKTIEITDPDPAIYEARKWTKSQEKSIPKESFTFMTYNILSTKYALTPKHGYCPKQYRKWTYRWERILTQIIVHDPDIFCLHEVDADNFETTMRPAFEGLKYHIIKYQRGNLKTSRVTCIFAKANSWDVTRTKVFFLDSLADKYFPKHPALRFSLQVLSNTALMVELVHETSKQKLYAVSSHNHWDPRNPELKSLQAFMLLRAVEEQFKEWEITPEKQNLVIGIDLNSLPHVDKPDGHRKIVPMGGCASGAYQLVTQRILPPTHIDHPEQRRGYIFKNKQLGALETSLSLKSAYREILGEEPLLTTKCADFVGCLDYIFFSGLAVVDVLNMPYNSDEEFSNIPNKDFPSDHLPLVGRFALCSSENDEATIKKFKKFLTEGETEFKSRFANFAKARGASEAE